MVKAKFIVDNTVLVNYALVKREDLLKKVFGKYLFTTQFVMKELRDGEEKGILPKRDWAWIKILKIESEHEKRFFELLTEKLGSGESSCLSLAASRDMKILTDDLDTRRYAQRRGIPVSGTIGVLVVAVKKDFISLNEGNGLLWKMIEKGYYSPTKKIDDLIF